MSERKEMTITFFIGGMKRGGAERVISILAKHYSELGWNVDIVLLLNDSVDYTLNNINIIKMVRKGSYIKSVPGWLYDNRRYLKNRKPDRVVSFVGRINLLVLTAKLGLKLRTIVSERNDPANDSRSAFEMKLCKFFYGKADRVIFQTKYQQKYYGERCGNNSLVIANPIEAPVYEGIHPSEDIISVGRLMDQKNHPMLIRAFSAIADKHTERKLHIFGEGKNYAELDSLIKSLKMENRIVLEGSCSNIFEKMREYRYFVMTSDYEGLSNALLEAMTSGMLCISTAWNGIEDVVEDCHNAYLVDVGDEEALSVLLDDVLSGRKTDCSPAGVETARQFQADRIICQWFEAIETM